MFVLTGVSESGLTSLGAGDDSSLGDEGVCQGGLAVIDVSNHGHVSDILLFVHDLTDLVNREVDHIAGDSDVLNKIKGLLSTQMRNRAVF